MTGMSDLGIRRLMSTRSSVQSVVWSIAKQSLTTKTLLKLIGKAAGFATSVHSAMGHQDRTSQSLKSSRNLYQGRHYVRYRWFHVEDQRAAWGRVPMCDTQSSPDWKGLDANRQCIWGIQSCLWSLWPRLGDAGTTYQAYQDEQWAHQRSYWSDILSNLFPWSAGDWINLTKRLLLRQYARPTGTAFFLF